MLEYKKQVLESLQQEYATAQGAVIDQENRILALNQEYSGYDDEFSRKKQEGMSVIDAMTSEGCLRAMEIDMKRQDAVLKKLEKTAEEKRQEMIVAKQETSSAEKLREKKLEAYKKEVEKSEEAMIDELVASNWSMNRQSVS